MSSSDFLARLLDQAQLEFANFKPLIPTYSHLLISALFPIYIGAHASLTRPSSAAKPAKREHTEDGADIDEDEDEEEQGEVKKMEGLEPSDAIMFPIMAGLSLASLYFLIKWLKDPAILNRILGFYFSQAGLLFAVSFIKDGLSILRSFAFPSRYSLNGVVWKANQNKREFVPIGDDGSPLKDREHRKSPFPGLVGSIPLPSSVVGYFWRLRGVVYKKATLQAYVRSVVKAKTSFTILDIVSVLNALVIVVYFTFVKKPWWLTNFLGFSFSYGAMQFMSPTTFWTGSLILSSLFFYDIYFVFFTPLMVTVAKKLDIPIKLLFPRPSAPGEDPDLVSLAMLGLGDIVVPGMMIGLALRFDLFLYYKAKAALNKQKDQTNEPKKLQYVNATGGWGERFWTCKKSSSNITEIQGNKLTPQQAKSFPKTYFHASIIGYIAGMLATLLAMQISSHAQPALLYLVPGVLSSLWITAFVKGDIKEMWNFSDAFEEEEEEGDDGEGGGEDEKTDVTEPTPPQGLFSKVFFGETKPEKPKSKNSKSKPKSEAKDKKLREDGKSTSTSTSLDLISFSISLPKPKDIPTSTEEEKGKEKEKEIQKETAGPSPSTSTSSSPVFVSGDGNDNDNGDNAEIEQPVPKKRRTRRAA
ncbi:hypothetical protein FQN50_009844 [Emmonsiellopsis sp. PD_5]|nr:hypothetical protein FQN50_009844 [Emmonsiellopsis sp. PD_5]